MKKLVTAMLCLLVLLSYAAVAGGDDDCEKNPYSINSWRHGDTDCDPKEIPEFGTIAGSLAAFGAAAGYVLLRRRH